MAWNSAEVRTVKMEVEEDKRGGGAETHGADAEDLPYRTAPSPLGNNTTRTDIQHSTAQHSNKRQKK
jgi:hypothetical protein